MPDMMPERRPSRPRVSGRLRRLAPALVLALCLPAAPAAQTIEELKRLTLEEMLDLEVTTVSRTPGPAGLTPAALFVLTRDDIRRSGATSLAELLRMAPGMHVAQMDALRWAIGMRGLADRLSRSMLVLIDGRPVYNPLFAGTYWEVQDLVLADIDRIEIIRGPGGTLWGANAVNGIISIVTRSAAETQGLYVHAIAGGEERGLGTIRYGMPAGSNGFVRGYFKGFSRDAQFHPSGLDFDDWWKTQGGVRADWTFTNDHALMVRGDVYTARLGQRRVLAGFDPPYSTASSVETPVGGGSVAARWSGPQGRSRFDVDVYYDRTRREEMPVGEARDTFEVDFQQRQAPWRGHQLTWGAAYRVTSDDITAVATSSFTPASYTDHVFSAFADNEVPIGPLRVSFGSKIERNTYSGVELQPSTRTTWQVTPSHTIVGSVARAVRTPSRVERHYQTSSPLDPALPSFVRLMPNPDFEPEKLVAYELGYRVRPWPDVYVTVSGFYNQLDDVLSTDLLTAFVENVPPQPARLIVPVSFRNGLSGNSRGVETTADVRPATWWRTTLNYSFLDVELERLPGSTDVTQERAHEGRTPHHQVQLRTAFDLPRQISFDWFLRYVSDLTDGGVPSYATSDVRVGWQPVPSVEIAVVGKNLHEARHREWPGTIEIQRSAFVSVTFRR